MKTFEDIFPTLAIPGEFDLMDKCDQCRWYEVMRQLYNAALASAHVEEMRKVVEAAKEITHTGIINCSCKLCQALRELAEKEKEDV